MDHTRQYFENVKAIADGIDLDAIERMATALDQVRTAGGRLFFLGVGGSAANCSHAVNDFRKLCGIETYAPTDNVSELTARINDEGWEGALAAWLTVSKLNARDAVFILSVGGGNRERGVSVNLINAIDLALERGAAVLGIVGRDGGYTKEKATVAVVVPTVNDKLVTPHSEAFQAVVWHCLVSHPLLQIQSTKW